MIFTKSELEKICDVFRSYIGEMSFSDDPPDRWKELEKILDKISLVEEFIDKIEQFEEEEQ